MSVWADLGGHLGLRIRHGHDVLTRQLHHEGVTLLKILSPPSPDPGSLPGFIPSPICADFLTGLELDGSPDVEQLAGHRDWRLVASAQLLEAW